MSKWKSKRYSRTLKADLKQRLAGAPCVNTPDTSAIACAASDKLARALNGSNWMLLHEHQRKAILKVLDKAPAMHNFAL